MQWTQQTIEQLAFEWSEGKSAAVIGAQLGFSRDAVISKARRMELPAPPVRSAIFSCSLSLETVSELRAAGRTWKAISAQADVDVTQLQHWYYWHARKERQKQGIVARAPVDAPAIVEPLPEPPHEPLDLNRVVILPDLRATVLCCYPIGDPREKDFRWCDDVREPGRSYCREHDRLCVVRKRIGE